MEKRFAGFSAAANAGALDECAPWNRSFENRCHLMVAPYRAYIRSAHDLEDLLIWNGMLLAVAIIKDDQRKSYFSASRTILRMAG